VWEGGGEGGLAASRMPMAQARAAYLTSMPLGGGLGQEYCAKNPGPLCNSGGEDWAVPPVGNAANADVTRWTPKTDAELAGPGAGDRAGEKFGCACVKNCACTDVVCNCLRKSDRAPVGRDAYFKTAKFGDKTAVASAGRCGCSCGGVLGYKR
jgi:hypothetical protein